MAFLKMKKDNNRSEILDYIESHIDSDIEKLINGEQIDLSGKNIPEFDADKVFQNVMSQIHTPSYRRIILRWTKWVAIFIVMLSMGYMTYRLSQMEDIELNEIYSPKGEKMVVILADGTRVDLNADTHLYYPERFSGKNREVILSGEAYFSVEKDSDHPFIVRSKDMMVKVTGTKFNVRAYKEDSCIVTTLDEGKIFVGDAKEKQNLKELFPGQYATYIPGKKTCEIATVANSLDASGWKNNLFNFRDNSLEYVLEEMARQYDVTFNVTNPEIRSYTYNISCSSKDIDEIIHIMETVTPIKFSKQGDNVYDVR